MAVRTPTVLEGKYLGGLTKENLHLINEVKQLEVVPELKNILEGITLHDYQTIGAAYAYFSPNCIIGDDPGLGKTVQYAAYLKILEKKGELGTFQVWKADDGTVLRKERLIGDEINNLLEATAGLLTEGKFPDYEIEYNKFLFYAGNASLFQMYEELSRYTGLEILPVYGGKKKINQQLTKDYWQKYDGIVVPHSAINQTLEFNKFLAQHIGAFKFLAVDESSALKNHKSQRYEMMCNIAKNFDRKVFLNGTVFETSLMDFYNQLDILDTKMLPSKSKIESAYAIKESSFFYKGHGKRQYVANIVGYKFQDVFKESVSNFYLGRAKEEVYDQIPAHNYQVIPILPTPQQQRYLDSTNYEVVLNSPTTSAEELPIGFNVKEVPKLEKIVGLVEEQLRSGTVVIYCRYRHAQQVLQETLNDLVPDAKATIINGDVTGEQREERRIAFNNGEYNILIMNIEKEINLPNAQSLIFYTTSGVAMTNYQIMCRIDRNNMTVKKNYFFLTYIGTPEEDRLIDTIYDREFQANAFTGKDNQVFSGLKSQMGSIARNRGLFL